MIEASKQENTIQGGNARTESISMVVTVEVHLWSWYLDLRKNSK